MNETPMGNVAIGITNRAERLKSMLAKYRPEHLREAEQDFHRACHELTLNIPQLFHATELSAKLINYPCLLREMLDMRSEFFELLEAQKCAYQTLHMEDDYQEFERQRVSLFQESAGPGAQCKP